MEKHGIREVIQGMLDVEQQAQQLVSSAEQQSQEMLVKARDEAERRVEQARRQAMEQAHRTMQMAVEEAQRRREEEIRRHLEQDAPIVEAGRRNIDKAVEAVVREVARG